MHITTIGLDLAKHWFQIHGIDAAGRVAVRLASEWLALWLLVGPSAVSGSAFSRKWRPPVQFLTSFPSTAAMSRRTARRLVQKGGVRGSDWPFARRKNVVPHVSQTIDSTVEAINAGLQC